MFARYLRSPGGLLPDGSVAAPSARRSRGLRERSRTLASSRQVLARSTRWCSRRSPGGVLEVVQGCTGREAQLPVLSDVVAPAVVAPAAGADSSEGGRGPARGDVVTAQAAAAELIARRQSGLSAFTSSPAALWQDGSLWTSSLGVLVADDLVAHIGRLRAAHAALLASVDGVDGVEREWALLDACKRSPTDDSPEQRRFGRAVLDLQAVQLRLCRFLVELEPHAVGSSGEPVGSRSSASASVPDRSSRPRDAGLDDGVVHTGGNTGVVAGAETRASSAADGEPDADHAVPIRSRFGIAESEAAAAGAGAEAGASSASDRCSGPVGAAVEHGAPQVLGDRRVVPVGEERVRAGVVPPDRVPDEHNAVPLTVRVHETVVAGVAGNATRSCASLRRAGHPGICGGRCAVRFEETGQAEVGRSRQDRRCWVRRVAGIRGCRVAGCLRLLVPTPHLARFGAAVTGPLTTRSVLGRCAL